MPMKNARNTTKTGNVISIVSDLFTLYLFCLDDFVLCLLHWDKQNGHDYYRVTLCIFHFQFFDVKRFASHVMLKIRGDVNLLILWAEYWHSFLPWYPSCNDSLEWPSAASPGESLVLSFQSWDACVEDQTQRALIVQRRVAGKWDQYTVNEHVNGTLPEKAYATNYCIY